MGSCFGTGRFQDIDEDGVVYKVSDVDLNNQSPEGMLGKLVVSQSGLKIVSKVDHVHIKWESILRLVWDGQRQLRIEAEQESGSGSVVCSFACKEAASVYMSLNEQAGWSDYQRSDGAPSPGHCAAGALPSGQDTSSGQNHLAGASTEESLAAIFLVNEQKFLTGHSYVNLTPYSNLMLPVNLQSEPAVKANASQDGCTEEEAMEGLSDSIEDDDVFSGAGEDGTVSTVVPSSKAHSRRKLKRCRSCAEAHLKSASCALLDSTSPRRKSTGNMQHSSVIVYTPVVCEKPPAHATVNKECMKLDYSRIDHQTTAAMKEFKRQLLKTRTSGLEHWSYSDRYANQPRHSD